MKFIRRLELPADVIAKLQKKQALVNALIGSPFFSAEKTWDGYRKTKCIIAASQVLGKMAGKRRRCMYCVDSEGSDIEHFRPKAPYPKQIFVWENLLLCCSQCGRIKGVQFPLDNSADPLLIDPTSEQPWDFLDFDPQTGNLVAKFNLERDQFEEKGIETVKVLKLNMREGLAEGYRRSWKRIVRVINRYTVPDATLDVPEPKQLIKELKLNDEHGLLEWCFKFSGIRVSPIKEFCEKYPKVCTEIMRVV